MPVWLEGRMLGCRLFAVDRQAHARQPAKFPIEDPARIELGLLNNMSDSALEQTERQILKLLHAAAGSTPIRLRLYALTDVPRGDWGRQHLERVQYYSPDDLWHAELDGLIVTGAEPRAASLIEEPYWHSLTRVFDWANDNTISTAVSCLAVHAAALHLDGIDRLSLVEKCFGVFEFEKVSNHPLLNSTRHPMRSPHSRWNEIPERALSSCGYEILTRANDGGVDMFTKCNKSLFVFFQGHPEYEAWTLLGEYRRDVARFLGGEIETYPMIPRAYFDAESTLALESFQDRAIANPHRELMTEFPTDRLVGKLAEPWRADAVQVYANWLSQISERKGRRTRAICCAASR